MSRNVPQASAHGLRNPWLESGVQPEPRGCSDSSSGSVGPPAYCHLDTEHTSKEELAYRRHPLELASGRVPLPAESTGKYLLSRERGVPVPRPLPNHTDPAGGRRSRPVSARAATPVSAETSPAIVPWGGHCVPLETFCHYFLQVVFVVGVMGGACLTAAGALSWHGLTVLTYIGLLTCLVSGLLLSVQCCVRRRTRPAFRPHTLIPLQEIPPPPHHFLPLLPKQNTTQFREETGIPWWRREHS